MRRQLAIALSMLFVMSVLIGLVSGDTSVIQPSSKDATVSELSPGENFGSLNSINAGGASAMGSRNYAYVAWTISIPEGSIILDAQMELYMSEAPDFSNTLSARRVTASWTEDGITWNNKPSATGFVDVASGTTDNVWIAWNITSYVDDWVNEGETNEGVRVQSSTSTYFAKFRSRDWGTPSERPKLTITYTPFEPTPSYLVRLAGELPIIDSAVGETNTEFNTIVENTGTIVLGLVSLELKDHNYDVKTEVNLLNIGIGEHRSHQFIYTHGLSEGTYAWQLNATYESIIESWNFTLDIGPSGSLIKEFTSLSVLQPAQITVDGYSTLSISISNVGTEAIIFRVSATSIDLIISPTTSQIVIIGGYRETTIDFIVVPLEDGKFWLSTFVTPINITSGVGTGRSDSNEHLLIVTKAAVIITFNAQDIGINDAILHGKISSLGGFATAKVYFVLWETGLGIDSAVVLPPNKQVIAYVSDFRVWYGNLVPDTDYSYEVRMELGPSSNPFIYYGGIIEFSTSEAFTDPFVAMRNGLAGFLGLDSIIMGVVLSVIFIIIFTVLLAELISERIEGMAATIVMATSIFSLSSVFFAIQWLPLWILIFLGVILAVILTGLFRSGSE